uniref:Uncharacterized protein n=1 Tax=Sphingobacterium sp. (strain 21) TaxID=743722 RepID=F4C2E9_SPHS2
MIHKIIAFHARQIESIHELANTDGTRKIGTVYFIDDPNQSYYRAQVITAKTDQKELIEQIQDRMIYIADDLQVVR